MVPPDITELKNAFNDVFESNWISNFAKYARHLESQLRDWLGVKYALTVANGTTGLQILLSTLPKHSEVLVPSFTFPATIHAIVHAHLKPKFVDIERATYNLCPYEVKANITKNTSAILAVNVFGNPCRIDELEIIAKEHRLKLFFDSAAAFGSKYRDRLLGSFGDAEVFSLSGTKIVTAGEGGVITTNDDVLAQELDCKRNYGYSRFESDCLYIGFNGKLNELNAIIALWSLQQIESNIARRKEIAQIYYKYLKKIPGIKFQRILEGYETNYCAFALDIDSQEFGLNASTLCEYLNKEDIETLRYFCPPMHKTRAYQEFNHLRLEQSEILSERNLCLPMHAHLTVEQAHTVCDAIEMIYNDARQEMQEVAAVGDGWSATSQKQLGNFKTKFPQSLPEMQYASAEVSGV
jgi:dTDP-4-amino-4,6-dideoxygalactose transaminase